MRHDTFLQKQGLAEIKKEMFPTMPGNGYSQRPPGPKIYECPEFQEAIDENEGRSGGEESYGMVNAFELDKAVSDNDLRDAWYQAHRPAYSDTLSSPSSNGYIDGIVIDESAVIVSRDGKYYKVPYKIADGKVTFDEDKAKEIVRTWKPA